MEGRWREGCCRKGRRIGRRWSRHLTRCWCRKGVDGDSNVKECQKSANRTQKCVQGARIEKEGQGMPRAHNTRFLSLLVTKGQKVSEAGTGKLAFLSHIRGLCKQNTKTQHHTPKNLLWNLANMDTSPYFFLAPSCLLWVRLIRASVRPSAVAVRWTTTTSRGLATRRVCVCKMWCGST